MKCRETDCKATAAKIARLKIEAGVWELLQDHTYCDQHWRSCQPAVREDRGDDVVLQIVPIPEWIRGVSAETVESIERLADDGHTPAEIAAEILENPTNRDRLMVEAVFRLGGRLVPSPSN